MFERKDLVVFLTLAGLPVLYYNLGVAYSNILNVPLSFALGGLAVLYYMWRRRKR